MDTMAAVIMIIVEHQMWALLDKGKLIIICFIFIINNKIKSINFQ